MRRIGRYAVLGLLGRGGMGAVYKAAMPGTGRVVALKVLLPSEMLAATADPAELRRAFFREAALMARIRHPCVAQVLDVDEDASGRPFFAMEYYCANLGAQLGESYRIEEPTRRLGVGRALALARQLAGALARLHYAGILHRDVKPYNLMLAEAPPEWSPGGDVVKLIDFGLSRLRGEVPRRVARGALVGSPYYVAPEQEADPDSADERGDVFSAGVTLFRCLTGRLPQEGVPASALRPGLDDVFDAFFARCCAVDPKRRPPSARALLGEVEDLLGHWEALRAAACALPPEAAPAVGTLREPAAPALRPPVVRPLRARPVRQPLKGARVAFGLDELWRPRPLDPERLAPRGGDLVADAATGLLWQRGGSPYPCDYAGAAAYAAELNARRFAGRAGWRLPTVAELCILLTPDPEPGRLCLPPLFSPVQRRLWSADRKSFVAAWYADAEQGFIWWQDFTCEFHVRCVTEAE